jgi:hypothetical protein
VRFEDEQYVKIYKRDTATWKAMNWQGRAILSLLVRKADGAGLMETSSLGRVDGVAALIDMPTEVVAPGLDSLMKLKVVQWLKGDVLLLPRYVEAQEARKTESAKKRGQRETARDLARAANYTSSETDRDPGVIPEVNLQHAVDIEYLSHDVPTCPTVSQPVPLQIRPDQTRSDQTSSDLSQQPLIDDDARKEKPPRAPSQWEEIWEHLCTHRWGRLKEAGEVEPEDEQVSPILINTGLKRVYETLAALEDSLVEEPDHLELLWVRYLKTDFAASTNPPYCLKAFLSEKVFMRAYRAWEAEPPRSEAGGG